MKPLLRTFARSPGFFAVVLLTLVVGIGANTAIFSVVRGILLRPLPYHEPGQLVGIGNLNESNQDPGPLSVLEYLDLRDQAQRVQSMAAWASGDANLTGAGGAERVPVGYVQPELLPVLGVAPAAGRWFTAGEDAPGDDHVVVMTDGMWKRRYGSDPTIVGKDILLDNESFKVVGVLPASFTFESPFDLYVPLGFTAEMRAENTRDQHWLRIVARMKPGVTVAALNQDLEVIGARARAAHPNVYAAESRWRQTARPLLDNIVAHVRPSLWLLAAAAGLVMLIVCGNVASLLLARASTKQREMSVRAALGATRGRLILHLLGESLVLSAIGGALGVVVALWGTDLLLSLAPEGLPRMDEIRVDGAVLLFSVLVTAVTGAIFGLIPAWSASRVDVQEALREGSRTSSGGKRPRRVRRALVVAETALALVLVTSAALVTRSFSRVMSVDTGFRTDGVLSLRVTLPTGSTPGADLSRNMAWFEGAVARLAALPGVTHVGGINRLPLADPFNDRLIDLEGVATPSGAERPDAQFRIVMPGYFETMDIPLVEGRTIGRQDGAGAPPVAVVSRSFARHFWADHEALGHRFRLSSPQGPWVTIVGVVGDVHDGGPDLPTFPQMYMPAAQIPGVSWMSLVVRGAVPMAQLGRMVGAELEKYDPQQPIYDMQPMGERLEDSVQQRRFVLVLFELFAALALGLAALGLYGLLAHSVAERQREIGVRVALGATRVNVMTLVAREGALLIAVGVALGIAGGLAGSRLLTHLLYEISPTDPLALLAAIVLLLGAAAVAMWLPIRRALRVDPMVTLRDE